MFCLVMLLAVCDIQADSIFKVNGEDIKKTPTLITLDYSKAGYVQVQFSDSSVVSYNMNLVEIYPKGVVTSMQESTKEMTFFHITGHVGDFLHIEGVTAGSEIAIYSANGEQKYRGQSNSENTTVDVSRLSGGVYILRVGRQAVKFIKE